ncbi:MAG: hypothetical protein GF411_06135 [Candidatus Lokiarchaeota archaeon]|nr:hypothetical protein [Candidatus Lokiarchaeota archaeon]
MEIEVRVTSENPVTGDVKKTCRAFLTYVAIGEDGNPVPVPQIVLTTKEEKDRHLNAQDRRKERLKNLRLEPVEW